MSLFAGLGGAVWASTASPSPADRAPFELQHASVLRATGTPRPASGTHVGMWWNRSSATTTVQGPGRLHFSAIGSYCEGWPLVEISVDGERWWHSYVVSAERYGAYSTGPELPAGRHEVSFRMVNDRSVEGRCDRNLFLADAWVEDAARPGRRPTRPVPPTAPSPTPTESAPTTPEPSDPGPTSPTPSEQPTSPGPSEPGPSAPEPSAPEPSDPEPSDPGPTPPGASGTGVPAGTRLTVHHGDMTITRDGTVVDGMEIRGFVKVKARDVVIKNSLVTGRPLGAGEGRSLVEAFGGQRGLRIVDSTLRGTQDSILLGGIKGDQFSAVRLDVSRVVDGVQVLGSGVRIEDSHIHDLLHLRDAGRADGWTHDDGIQIEGGDDITIRGNTITGAHTAAIMITQNVARSQDIEIAGNQLSGGGCTVNVSEKGRGPVGPLRIADNVFGAPRISGCGIVAPQSSVLELSGNRWETNGTAVPRRRGG